MKKFRSPHRPKKNQLIAGVQAVLDALQSGKALDRIFVDQKNNGAQVAELRKKAALLGVPINMVPAAKLNNFNIPEHGSCIAQIARVQYQNLQDVISFVIEQGKVPLFLILDGVTDIRNIGGIARTAWCCGVHAIIIPDRGVGALNDDAILTSAGALEKIAVCRVNSLMKAVDELHMNGIKVFASEMKASSTIADCDFSIPAAIVMGSEEKGIYPALLKICDENISIPMHNNFESLNVSVATGMILYEVMKQRNFGYNN
ncbi:MAG: 23S rRNA (guanosine(2251)-2'-O)-methyltransferase RlmB [Niabella sp.]